MSLLHASPLSSIFSRPTRPPALAPTSGLRTEVCPPALRHAPTGAWQRLLSWLLAPAPQSRATPPSRLPGVRSDFVATLADIDTADAEMLRGRLTDSRTLRELWHLRAEVYRVVGVAHSQCEAEARLALLNRHFPTRAPRSQFAPLL